MELLWLVSVTNSLYPLGAKAPGSKSSPSATPEPASREDFLQCRNAFQHFPLLPFPGVPCSPCPLSFTDWMSLTFDPDTTHHFLRMLEGNRKLINTSPWQHSYPAHPERFDHWPQALSAESLFQGRHYMEAQLSGEGAHVGLTYKGIERKGERKAGCIAGYASSWCMGRDSRGVFAWHANAETPLAVREVGTVGLYVDFQRGCLCFYDVQGGMRLLHEYRENVSEPLYLAAWMSKNNDSIHLADGK